MVKRSGSLTSRPLKQRPLKQAARVDKYRLYEESVQDPAYEIDFIRQIFRERGRSMPHRLREDFCGTAALACAWVLKNRRHTAHAVDLEPEVLEWSRTHHLARMSPAQRRRIHLVQADVRTARLPPVEALVAFNFSYWLFCERAVLKRYFRAARRGLEPGGLLFLDAYGGYECNKTCSESSAIRDYKYIWEQEEYDPISGYMRCHIHFRFKDGSSLRRAFSYEWRMWSLPELRELLQEAGFTRITVYWEGTDAETGEGDGNYSPVQRGEPDASWIAYLVAENPEG